MFSSWKGDFSCCYDPLMQYFLSRCVAFILLSLLTHWGHTDEPSGSKIHLHTHTHTLTQGVLRRNTHAIDSFSHPCSSDLGTEELLFLFSTVSYSGVKEAISFWMRTRFKLTGHEQYFFLTLLFWLLGYRLLSKAIVRLSPHCSYSPPSSQPPSQYRELFTL